MKASAMTRHSRGRRLSALAVVMAVALAALGFWGLWTLTVDFLSCSPAGLFTETRWRYDLADGFQIRGGLTDGAALVRAKNESVLMAVVPFDVTAFCTGDGYIGTQRTQRDGTVTYALIDSKSGETVGFYNTQEDFESACAEAGAAMGAWTSTGEAPEDAVFEACYVVDESPEYIEGNFLGSLGALFLNIEDSASVSAPYTPYDGSRLVRLRFDGESAALLPSGLSPSPASVWTNHALSPARKTGSGIWTAQSTASPAVCTCSTRIRESCTTTHGKGAGRSGLRFCLLVFQGFFTHRQIKVPDIIFARSIQFHMRMDA